MPVAEEEEEPGNGMAEAHCRQAVVVEVGELVCSWVVEVDDG